MLGFFGHELAMRVALPKTRVWGSCVWVATSTPIVSKCTNNGDPFYNDDVFGNV